MINIILPTCNRPQMLKKALGSIDAQSARDRINTVLVSENGGNRESQGVCNEFPELPIHYVFRNPPLSPLEHARIMMSMHLRDDYTAILHDDDWWTPDHLANACNALERNPDATSYYSGFFQISGESSLLHCDHNLSFWFGAGYPSFEPVWRLSHAAVTLATLLCTPGQYSTLVARTEAFQTASSIYFDYENPFDNDRMLILKLSLVGPVLFNPIPEVFIRQHPAQDMRSFPKLEQTKRMLWTTRWIVENCSISFPELGNLFVDRFELCPATARPMLLGHVIVPWCLPLLAVRADAPAALVALYRRLRRPWKEILKKIIQTCIPPVLFNAMKSLIRFNA